MDPFQIDPHALDKEFLKQPGMTRDAGVKEADARHAHDRAKATLAVVEARLALAVRANPSKFALRDKPNKEEIEAAVVLQPEYTKAEEDVRKAKYDLDIASAYAMAMIDRRKAIERLTDLIQLDYYAEREPRPHTADGRREAEMRARHASRRADDET